MNYAIVLQIAGTSNSVLIIFPPPLRCTELTYNEKVNGCAGKAFKQVLFTPFFLILLPIA